MDYKAMEQRILAHLLAEFVSKDRPVGEIDAKLDELDIHRARAAHEAGIPEEDVTPEQREAAKRLNFFEMYSGRKR